VNNIPLWAQIVIAILGSGTVGAIAGAISSSFASRQKIKELEVTYRQKLDDSYLTNARQHIDSLYMPINISLSKLADKYEDYTNCRISLEQAEALEHVLPPEDQTEMDVRRQLHAKELFDLKRAKEEFHTACLQHINLMDEIVNQGKDAYLIMRFEERLRSFTFFIKLASEITTYQDMFTLMPIDSNFKKLYGSLSPIGSPKFDQRFLRDINELKSSIKEVTLGMRSSDKDKSS